MSMSIFGETDTGCACTSLVVFQHILIKAILINVVFAKTVIVLLSLAVIV
jgi:hypothetical protein